MRLYIFLLSLIAVAFSYAQPTYQISYPIPNGWKLAYHVKNARSLLKEYLPANETLAHWQQMLTVLEFANMPEHVTPRDFLEKTFTLAKKECDAYKFRLFGENKTGNFPSALGIQYCGRYRRTGLGEVTLFKIIRHEKIYVVQLARRLEPFAKQAEPITRKELQDWLNFMKQVRLVGATNIKIPAHSTIKL